jgi:hypothetical protein
MWLSADLEPGTRGDDRRRPTVDHADDLAAIDALKVDAGDPEVRVPELALDDDQRDAFVGHLHRVCVSELVRR